MGHHPRCNRLHQPHAAARSSGKLAVHLFEAVLPRHMQIIYVINAKLIEEATAKGFNIAGIYFSNFVD